MGTDYGPYGRREEFRKSVMTMPKLEYLHIGHYSFHPSDIMFRRDTVRMLSQMFDKKFPTLNINYNPFSTQGPSQSDPNRKFPEYRDTRRLGMERIRTEDQFELPITPNNEYRQTNRNPKKQQSYL